MFTPPSKRQTRIYIKGKPPSRGLPFCFAWVRGAFSQGLFLFAHDGWSIVARRQHHALLVVETWRAAPPRARLPNKIAACEGLAVC